MIIIFKESELRNQKLGHTNAKKMSELIRFKAVKDLPKLNLKYWDYCGPCQKGKQVKTFHKKGLECVTTRCLELIQRI